ncbi:XRE family transcriptional regulator [Cryobacterium sp. TMT1-3]|uniref:XRE family transcriptional regulator n=1 Tax=Cryobacterium luteum TaxID=1424661 RepID=A0A1H8E5G1_9MICO|nr:MULTISPECIES: helix-turn-helix transcriptional regulator [Cryobacterium]TFB89815.1 XRE family transcriptional regulator [Cryobacterium luteum]TFC25529.1 XRE family transcriptional regulator [Cryobacterium sp. TMT1-3]SEN14685.1 DNA-binding transcriptional regulator, XRE-family HTH domain [Cryobacterium luteum]
MLSPKSEASRLLGLRLRERRLALALNQQDVALLAGLNVSNYARIDRGRGNPTMYTLIRVAAVLQLEISELVAGLAVEQLPPTHDGYLAIEFRRSQDSQVRRRLDEGQAGLMP